MQREAPRSTITASSWACDPRGGMLTHGPWLAARPHDSNHRDALGAGCTGIVPADTGVIDAFRHALWPTRHNVPGVTPARARMAPPPYTKAWRNASARWRKRLETVGSQWTERFAIAPHAGAQCVGPYEPRVIRKVLAHSVCVLLNRQLDRSPLDFFGKPGW